MGHEGVEMSVPASKEMDVLWVGGNIQVSSNKLGIYLDFANPLLSLSLSLSLFPWSSILNTQSVVGVARMLLEAGPIHC